MLISVVNKGVQNVIKVIWKKMLNILHDFGIKTSLEEEEIGSFEWLGKQSLDFYLPDYNIAIECQGEQHFNDVLFFNNISLEQRIELDERKFELCKEHNIDILYFTNIKIGEEFLKKHKYYFTVEELIEKINRYEKRDNLQD